MKPLDDRIIVEILEDENKIGSIIVPNKSENQKTKGKIIAIGCSIKYLQDEIKVGDTILYKKYAGTRISLDDKDCVMLREAELDAVIN